MNILPCSPGLAVSQTDGTMMCWGGSIGVETYHEVLFPLWAARQACLICIGPLALEWSMGGEGELTDTDNEASGWAVVAKQWTISFLLL